ncbi:MAG: acyl-CoA dehydrogenase family protein [Pseudonocardiaceae bacterium]
MTWDELTDDPVVAATRRLGAELTATAAQVERAGVQRADLDRLAALGLHGLGVDAERGGVPASGAVRRRVAELLAGSDPQVWFVWFQHGPVVAMLAASENTALACRWLPDLCTGSAYAGVAFSHLRSAAPSVRAERVADGYRLTGRQPWCTGWGLLDVVLVGALTEDAEALFALVPAADGAGLRSTGELSLAAMEATRTVGLQVEDLIVRDEDVVARLPYTDWQEGDDARNANVQPSTFGIGLAALELAAQRAPEVAERLLGGMLATRERAYRLIDEVPPAERVPERLTVRADALLQGMQAATTLVTSRGGAAFGLDDPAQRLLRAASHQLVHAQSQPVRLATLRRLDEWGRLEPVAS